MLYVQLIYHKTNDTNISVLQENTQPDLSAILVCVTLVIGTALGDFQCTKNSCQNPYSCAMEREILFLIFFFCIIL